MRRRLALRARIAAGGCGWALLTLVALALAPSPARADCFLNGSTVTCMPPGTGGFVAASDGLDVTVQSGATVSVTGFGSAGIKVNNTSTVTNNGTISGGNVTAGIQGTNGNTIVNNGAISVGDNGPGIFAADNNTITNNGSISVGQGGFGIGINDGNTATNYGTITTGQFGTGVQFGASNNTLYNYGTIRALDGTSIEACSCGATGTVNNYGTLDGIIHMTAPGNIITTTG
jgi:hypothetical protein